MRFAPSRLLLLITALALVVGGAFSYVSFREPERVVAGGECAPGFEPVADAVAEVRREFAAEGWGDGEAPDGVFEAELARELPMLQGVDPSEWATLCVVNKRPESLRELTMISEARAMPRLAPYGNYADGAAPAAARQAAALAPGSVPGTTGTAARWGKGPLIVDSPDYPSVNGLGLSKNMGRIDSFAFDPKAKRLFAAVGNGGIWRSDDMAGRWTSANGNLPTTVTGAVAWSAFKGGTLLALTGEPTFGSNAFTGLGAFWSADLGRHWKRASGLPSGALGFALAVDPAHPAVVYAATQRGLFRSVDGGRSYTNVKLPTGKCAGVTNMVKRPKCALASVVTDVVVAKGGGVNTETKAGTVVATVGWRGGNRANPDGSIQSPRNGVYRSVSGKPGTFTKLAATGFAAQDNIGRVELGSTIGAAQDHDVLYATVQDAVLLNEGGLLGIDLPDEAGPSPLGTTILNGIYVSADFGTTWTLLASGTELAADPLSGSALLGTGTGTGYQPGVQAWYNMWIQPDPTRADANGAPTRLAFGLEEVWSNDAAELPLPLDGTVPVHFRVVGKYFGGDTCLMLNVGVPYCPGDREPSDDNQTTHPDQQDGLWIRDASAPGGVQLVVGNDGGAYRYKFDTDTDTELDNSNWGKGDQAGFYTLMPYYAAVANDGTVYGGLQDNGNLKIDGATRKQYETYGGDGFFSAVDPYDSKITYEEYTNADMRVSTDGGTSWTDIGPGVTASRFVNPFAMDPTNAKHLVTAGNEVVETLLGPSTTSGLTKVANADASTTTWLQVFDLGTGSKPGDAAATATATDPDNAMTAITTRRNATYVGFCGYCDTLNKLSATKAIFKNGIATNIGGAKTAKAGTTRGWHVAAAKGLPNRYITSIEIDPDNAKTVYVTLGGYTRRWLPAGAVGDVNRQLGTGHLYVSHDGAKTFKDVSGNLPDAPATWVTLREDQLLVGTDVGLFASSMKGATQTTPKFARLGGIPRAPISSIVLKPNNPNIAIVATFGRGVWGFKFDTKVPLPPTSTQSSTPVLGEVLKVWNFEPGSDAWITGGGPIVGWTQGTPGHGSGTADNASGQSFGISGPVGYIDNMDATVDSPSLSLAKGKYVLQWHMKLDTESFDPLTVEYTNDGGTTWITVATFAGRNADFPGWTKYAVYLPSQGGAVQVRFHFVSDSLCAALGGPLCAQPSWDGVHVDDVKIGKVG
jgi:hypothetical protein